MKPGEEGKVVGKIGESPVEKLADFAAEVKAAMPDGVPIKEFIDVNALAKAKLEAVGNAVGIDGLEGEQIEANEQVLADAPWYIRLKLRFVLWVVTQLGLTYAIRQMRLIVNGLRRDLDAMAQNDLAKAQQFQKVVEQLNRNTRTMNAWEHGYPILHRIAEKMRAAEAAAYEKAQSNGSKIITPAQPEQPTRTELIIKYLRDEWLSLVTQGCPTIERTERLLKKYVTGVMVHGEALTDDEAALLAAEVKGLEDDLEQGGGAKSAT